MAGKKQSKKEKKLLAFPIVIICLIIYLILGFCFHLWHPVWIIFLVVPVYYGIVEFIFK